MRVTQCARMTRPGVPPRQVPDAIGNSAAYACCKPAAQPAKSARCGVLQRGDVDLAHLQHGLHDALGLLGVRVLQQLDQASLGQGANSRNEGLRLSAQRLAATIANIAPCGSTHWTIQLPPGTCIGPLTTWPPLPLTRAAAASTASTLK